MKNDAGDHRGKLGVLQCVECSGFFRRDWGFIGRKLILNRKRDFLNIFLLFLPDRKSISVRQHIP
jgi:hypothetical protein